MTWNGKHTNYLWWFSWGWCIIVIHTWIHNDAAAALMIEVCGHVSWMMASLVRLVIPSHPVLNIKLVIFHEYSMNGPWMFHNVTVRDQPLAGWNMLRTLHPTISYLGLTNGRDCHWLLMWKGKQIQFFCWQTVWYPPAIQNSHCTWTIYSWLTH